MESKIRNKFYPCFPVATSLVGFLYLFIHPGTNFSRLISISEFLCLQSTQEDTRMWTKFCFGMESKPVNEFPWFIVIQTIKINTYWASTCYQLSKKVKLRAVILKKIQSRLDFCWHCNIFKINKKKHYFWFFFSFSNPHMLRILRYNCTNNTFEQFPKSSFILFWWRLFFSRTFTLFFLNTFPWTYECRGRSSIFTAFFFIVCCMGSGIKSSSVNFLLVQRIVFNATPKPIRSLAFWICFRQLKRSAIRALVLVNPYSQSEKSVSRLTSANQNSFLKCVIKEEVTTNRAVRNARTVVVGYRLCPW